jgi:hypothetical protein
VYAYLNVCFQTRISTFGIRTLWFAFSEQVSARHMYVFVLEW